MEEYITHSRDETVALGRRLAAELAPGSLIAFTGGLGAGKTAFCQGIAEGLGCTDPCLLYTSPSPRDYAASRMPSSA